MFTNRKLFRSAQRKFNYGLLSAAAILATAHFARADSFTWTGGTNSNWDLSGTDLNWNDTTTPASGVAWSNSGPTVAGPGTATFDATSTAGTVNLVNDNILVTAITFNNSGWTIGTTGTGTLQYGSTGTMTITSATGVNTINAVIADTSGGAGTTSILANGAGLLVLGGTNTYSGTTTVTTGMVQVASDANLGLGVGAGNIVLNAGGSLVASSTFALNSARGITVGTTAGTDGGVLDAGTGVTLTYNGIIANNTGGTNSFSKGTGAGTVVLGGANTYTGATVVTGGMLQLLNTGSLASLITTVNAGTFQLVGGATLNTGSTLNVNGGATAGGTFDLNGSTQTVAGLNGAAGAVSGVITNSGANTTFTVNTTVANTYAGSINNGAGAIALVLSGTGTLTLTGTSTYSGVTTVNGGVLAPGSDAALGTRTGAGAIVMTNGTILRGAGTFTLNSARGITLGSNAGDTIIFDAVAGATMTYNGVLADNAGGSVNITKGTNTAASNGDVSLGGNNTYSGTTTTIWAGTSTSTQLADTSLSGALIVTANNALGTTAGGTNVGDGTNQGVLAFAGGVNYTTLETITILNGTSGTGFTTNGVIRSISGANIFDGAITLSSTKTNAFGIDPGSSLTLNGVLSGGGAQTVSKLGRGTLILNNAESYTGPTTAILTGNGGGASLYDLPGTLVLGPNGTIAGSAVTLENGAVMILDSTSSTGNIVRTNGITMGSGSILIVNGNSASSTTDTINGLVVGKSEFGEDFIVVNPGAGQSSTLALGSLSRDSNSQSVSNGGTINFKGPNIGQAAGPNVAVITFTGYAKNSLVGSTSSLNPSLAVTGMLPWATVTDTVSGLTSFATGPTAGGNIRPLSANSAGDYFTGAATGGLPAGNALITSGTTTVTTGATSNSLSLEGNNINVAGSGVSLRVGTVTGGSGLLSVGTGNTINATTLVFGATTGANEADIYVAGDLTINSAIALNGTSTQLAITKSGAGNLILGGTNTFLGNGANAVDDFRINDGMVSFSSGSNLGSTSNTYDIAQNATFHLLGSLGNVAISQTVSLRPAAGQQNDAQNTFIQVDGGSTLQLSNIVNITNTESGFTKTGSGGLAFSATGSTNNATSFLAGGSFTLTSTGGTGATYQTTGEMVAYGGTTINYNSSAVTAASTTRAGNIALNSATLNVTGNSANNTQDQIRQLIAGSGESSVAITPGSGKTSTLSINNNTSSSFLREAGATLVISGTGLSATSGSNVAEVTVGAISAAPALIGGIIPYILTDTTAGGSGTNFASIGGAGTTNIIPNATNVTTAIASGGNVNLTGSDGSAGTVNSLIINGSGLSVGSGTLTVTSGGILNLGGANTINATTLAFGTAEGIIFANTSLSVGGSITGSGGLTKSGAGVLTLSGSNGYTGTTWVDNGTLKVSADNNLGSSGNLGIGNGATLEMSSGFSTSRNIALATGTGNATIQVDSGAGTVSGVISDAVVANPTGLGSYSSKGNLQVSGSGTLTLTGANTYSGTTTVTGGTLVLSGSDNRLPVTTGVTLSGGTLVLSSVNQTIASLTGDSASLVSDPGGGTHTLTVTGTSQFSTSTYAGALSDGTGKLALANSGGILVLTNTGNTYSGGTTISGGELSISSLGNVGGASASINFSGPGYLQVTGTSLTTIDGNIGNASSFSGGFDIVAAGNTFTLNTALSGSGSLSKTGAGVLLVTGADTYTGNTNVTGGTLQLGGGNNRLPVGTNLSVVSATVDLHGMNQQVSGLSGNGAITNSTASTTGLLTMTGTSEFDGSLNNGSGIVALLKNTGGTLTLTGTSTFTGGTTVNGGATIQFVADANFGATTSTISLDNGTLLLGADDSSANQAVTLSASRGLILGPASGVSNGTINVPLNNLAKTITLTVGGAISDNNTSGTGNLVKVGLGTLVLTGTNTFHGTTSVLGGGTLSVINDAQFGTAPSAPTPSSIVIDGSSTLIFTPTAAFTLNSNRGIAIGPSSGSGIATINLNAAQTMTYSGSITNNGSGTGSLVKTGNASGSLVLGGADTYSGNTSILAGTLGVSNDNQLGTGTGVGNIILNGGTLLATGTFTLNSLRGISLGSTAATAQTNTISAASGAALTYGGVIANTNGASTDTLSKSGAGTLILGNSGTWNGNLSVTAGTLILQASNAYAGITNLTGGTLSVSNDNQLGTGAGVGNIILNGATLLANASFTLSSTRGIAVGNTTATGNGTLDAATGAVLTYNGTVANNGGTGSLIKGAGAGTVILGASGTWSGNTTVNGGTLVLQAANSYAGFTSLAGGVLSVSNDNQLGTGAGTSNIFITGTGSTLLANASFTLNSARGITLGSTASNGSGILDASGSAVLTYGGVIANNGVGTGNLIKGAGTGTVILSGANTYSGTTTVNGGTLVAANATGSATGTGSVTLNGGVLASATSGGTISGSVSAGTGAHTIAPGGVGTIGSLSIGGLTTNSNTTLGFDVTSTSVGDQLVLSGATPTFSIGAGTILAVTFTATPGSTGNYHLFDFTNGTAPAVPSALSTGLSVANGGAFSYSLADDGAYIDLVGGSGGPVSATWIANSGTGLWSDVGNVNWSGGTPNGVGTTATFNGTGTLATATVDVNVTVGTIALSGTSTSYSLGGAGTGSLTMDNGAGTAALISVASGTHAITAQVNTSSDSNLNIQVSSGASLSMGAINNAANKTITLTNGNASGGLSLGNVTNGTGTLTANGAAVLGNLSNNGAFNVNANVTSGVISGTGNTTVAAGQTLTATSVAQNTLTINNGSLVTIAASGTPNTNTSVVSTLAISGATNAWTGTLDIGDNSLVISNGGSGVTGQNVTRQVTNQIQSGLNINGTLWAGTGITSSAAAADASLTHGVGVIQNNAAGATVGDGTTTDQTPGNEIYTTFEGQAVSLNDTLVKYTWFGDADLSGVIDSTDYFLIDNGFANGLSGWINGDFDYSGTIDSTDYFLIDNAFANQSGPLSAAFVLSQPFGAQNYQALLALGEIAGTPEPTSLALLGLGAVGLLARRKRRTA